MMSSEGKPGKNATARLLSEWQDLLHELQNSADGMFSNFTVPPA